MMSNKYAKFTYDSQASRLRLYVGLDFGTTYTGVAYCLSSDPSIDKIEVLTQWPGVGNSTQAKTLTEICYQPGRDPLWGYQADGSVGERSGTYPIYGRFKLLLNPDTESGNSFLNRALANLFIDAGNKAATTDLPPGKTAMEVTTDFLTPLYSYVMEHLGKRIGGKGSSPLLNSTPIEWIITVPAIWTHKAQEATKRAAMNAGFGSRVQDTIKMVSEPEAAALYTLKDVHSRNDGKSAIEIGDDFVICDAGGGTVAIEQIKPVLKFTETVVGGGGKCGSTYIDEAFHKFLGRKIGPDFDNVTKWTPRRKGRGSPLMKRFDIQKKSFGSAGEADKWYAPLPVDVADNKAAGIIDNELEVTKKDMMGVFDPTVNKVIDLVEEQVEKTRRVKPNGKISTILLVGGFGESNYLYKQLKAWGQKQYPPINVQNPSNAWSAIVRGAVMHAIAPSVISRKLRMHYGVKIGTGFIDGKHDEADAYYNPFSGKCSSDNVDWMAHLGEDASNERRISFPVYTTFKGDRPKPSSLSLKGCKFEDAPKSAKNFKVQHIGSVPYDLSGIPRHGITQKLVDGVLWSKCDFTIEMQIASGENTFSVNYDGTTYGRYFISHDS